MLRYNRVHSLKLCSRYFSGKSTAVLKRPQINFKHIEENREAYEESLRRRAHSPRDTIGIILENRQQELEHSHTIDKLKNERSKLGEIVMKINKSEGPGDPDEKKALTERLQEIKTQLKIKTGLKNGISMNLHKEWENLPNLLDPTVPEDPDNGSVVEFINGSSESQIMQDRPVRNHLDHKNIGERMGLMDFYAAARVSGFGWYYLIGDGALLEQALIQYGLSKARQNGYKMITPPTMVKNEIINACGFKPQDKNDEDHVYSLKNHDLGLTGTAEIPLGAFHSNETITGPFPKKYVGISRAYRAEAGSRGKQTKGLYRVHEFNKVELFHFTTPDRSTQELEDLRQLQTEVITELGLSAKMINMPTTDLGAPAMKKYDCEAWMPGRGSFGELTSSSNCGDYQSRRLGVFFKPAPGEKPQHVHTLNGTCIAVPRVIVAIIEQNYDVETRSILIPEVLRPFMDGKERIYPQEGSQYALEVESGKPIEKDNK